MNKTELIHAAAERSGMTVKDTEQVLEALLGEMYTALAAGERVLLTGFGTFEPKRRAERMGRNLHTGEQTVIPATTVLTFKPSKLLKDAVAEQE